MGYAPGTINRRGFKVKMTAPEFAEKSGVGRLFQSAAIGLNKIIRFISIISTKSIFLFEMFVKTLALSEKMLYN